MKYILALDQGTTSSRALLFNERAQVVWLEQEEFAQHYPASGWVEHDALEIWETTRRCVDRALRRSGVRAEEIAAVGLTNQRETTILWDRKTGDPLAPAIVWQDRRTADFCEELRRRGEEEMVGANRYGISMVAGLVTVFMGLIVMVFVNILQRERRNCHA